MKARATAAIAIAVLLLSGCSAAQGNALVGRNLLPNGGQASQQDL
jgi:hypothetical protein